MNAQSTIRWGIVGAGMIAHRFAEGLAFVPGTTLGGVWSRRPEPAAAFAAKFHTKAYESFDALLDNIDALYILSTRCVRSRRDAPCFARNRRLSTRGRCRR
jgi:predicted dehydrogenase